MNTHPLPAEEPITEDDAFIAAALESASVPTLMMAMVHVSGDTSWLDGPIRPNKAIMGEVQGFLSDDDKATVRRRAVEVLRAYRDRGCTLPPPPSAATVHRMMNFMVGEEVPDDYVPMMLEEMALDGVDARDLHWDESIPAAARAGFHVLVIGAGMSGLLAAIRLQDAGFRYTVIEKNAAVGGTWHENSYPGCRVDIANHFYSYSFEPNHDWSHYYSEQPEIQRYFDDCADKYEVRPHIRFETEVVEARYHDLARRWRIRVRGRDAKGEDETFEVDAVISAVGQLNRPKIPDVPGLESFGGVSFHSAAWRHDVDLTGKRVAVVGSGASALQLVPEVAKRAATLYVMQRSPSWMFPNPAYHRSVSEGAKWLLKHVPYYARWYRFLLFWPGSDGLLPSLIVDPSWPHQDRSINETNEAVRELFTDYMAGQIGEDRELLEKVVPKYPPFGKRMLQDNGSWLAALQRDNVELVASGLAAVRNESVVDEEGNAYPVDVIVFATGFHADRFLWPMDVVGRDGVHLNDLWGDDPKAYLGITVPDFPNLFCLYGPATNLAHAGSIIFHSECQVRYIMACLKALLAGGHRAMDCKHEVNDAFNQRLDEALRQTVWAHPGMTSWYKNSKGRVVTTSPWRLLDYWRWTKEPNLDDYELID